MIMKAKVTSNLMTSFLVVFYKSRDLNGSGLTDWLAAGNSRGINNKTRLKMVAPFVEKGQNEKTIVFL